MRPTRLPALILALLFASSQASAAPAPQYVDEVYTVPGSAADKIEVDFEPDDELTVSQNMIFAGTALLLGAVVLTKQARDISRKEEAGLRIPERKLSQKKMYSGFGAVAMMAGALGVTIGVTLRF